MHVARRWLLTAAPIGALVTLTARAETTDLALTCDVAAAAAVAKAARAFRARTGIRVRIFPTVPNLIVPQLEREIQNDIVVTQPALLDAAEKAGVITPGGRTPAWRNRLVIATAARPAGPPGSFAIPDPTPGADFDGAQVLQRMNTTPTKLFGVLDTASVAWMLSQGEAEKGILHQTEVAADDALRAVAPVPDSAWDPILYAATVTKLSYRPNPAGFLNFLTSPDGQAAFKSAGLEAAA